MKDIPLNDLLEISKNLEMSEKRVLSALKHAEIGVWEWDLETNWLYWDNKMFELFGVEKDSFVNTYDDFIKAVHPDDVQKVEKKIKDCMENKNKVYYYCFRVKRGNAYTLITGRGGIERNLDGQPVKMTGICYEVNSKCPVRELL